jgi:AhpD family alkylhydroperoxidase
MDARRICATDALVTTVTVAALAAAHLPTHFMDARRVRGFCSHQTRQRTRRALNSRLLAHRVTISPRRRSQGRAKYRLNYAKVAPGAYQAMLALEQYLAGCGLDRKLLELVKMRASQINGCAFCIQMHAKDARAAGETETRLYGLNAWRESPFYDVRERSALAWTEAVTTLDGHVPDDVYAEARAVFDDKELVDLTWAVGAINLWNRVAISFRTPPSS